MTGFLLFLVGLGFFVYGCYLFSPGLAFIAGGAFLMWFAIAMTNLDKSSFSVKGVKHRGIH